MRKRFYILFIFGNLGSADSFQRFVESVFQSITTDNVKFVHDHTSTILYFSSQEKLDELSEFFEFIFDNNIAAFFLIEEPKQMGVRLREDLYTHLFDLQANGPTPILPYPMSEGDLDQTYKQWNEQQIRNFLGDQDPSKLPPYMNNEDDENFNEIAKIRKTAKPQLNMNEILDKILQSGVESLSEDEQRYLSRVSKQR